MSLSGESVTEEPPLSNETEPEEINEEKRSEPNAEDDKHPSYDAHVDKDAQEMVIASLRTQVQDLFSQVNQLNTKLVRSYDRYSDLEDALHTSTTSLQLSTQKVSALELEKSQHLSQLTSGLLVEKSHVTAELTRLMERATEEAAQRGQAENAKDKIERELEELSASLFGEANGMVHEARIARSLSERKVEEAEGRLREAEEAVRVMQSQMQALMQEKEKNDEERTGTSTPDSTRSNTGERLMKGHLAYHEFLTFLAHLRQTHASNPNGVPPAIATLLQLPFLARLLNESAEPTLRLDFAPSLNWLSRRSVLSAIHAGQLIVEPISATTLLTMSIESPLITIAGMVPSSLHAITTNLEDLEINIPCALCGSAIFPNDTNSNNNNVAATLNGHSHPTETHLSSTTPNFASMHISIPSHTTWSAAAGSFFRKPSNPLTRALSNTAAINGVSATSANSTSPSNTAPSTSSTTPSGYLTPKYKHTSFNAYITTQTQIYIFRLASPSSSASAALSSFTLPLSKPSSSQPVPPPMAHHPNSSSASSSSSSRPASAASLSLSSSSTSSQPTTFYPLCASGWCLARLRATCTLWSFVRTGIVEKIWDEEVVLPTPSSSKPGSPARTAFFTAAAAALAPVSEPTTNGGERPQEKKALPTPTPPPPVPPRRRGLWGIASALGEKAASWGEGVGKGEKGGMILGGRRSVGSFNSQHEDSSSSAAAGSSTEPAAESTPPPLPKRSLNRSTSTNPPAPTVPDESTTEPSAHTTTRPDRTESGHTRGPSASSLSRAVHVPLPESRPSTPAPAPVEATVKVNGDATTTPSRTASPAALAGVHPPPPVPRRAAARNKGTVPGVVGSSSDSDVTRKDLEAEGRKVGVEVVVGVKEAENASVAVAEVETEGEERQSKSITEKVDDDETKTVTAVLDEKADRTVSGASVEGSSEGPTWEMQGAKTTDKDDQAQYVGTSTWEERTWRELVRIQKDMFYARIGAVHSVSRDI